MGNAAISGSTARLPMVIRMRAARPGPAANTLHAVVGQIQYFPQRLEQAPQTAQARRKQKHGFRCVAHAGSSADDRRIEW